MAAHKRGKLTNRGRSPNPAPETDSAPIRATVPLIEQYYVAVDRQLKSGFETYDAAERAAKEIKKRSPNPQVTVFDAKKRTHSAAKTVAGAPSDARVANTWAQQQQPRRRDQDLGD
jgi:hypothetical protein